MLLNDCKKASIYSLQNAYLCDATVSNIKESSVVLTMQDTSADFLTSEVHITFYDGTRGLVTYACELSGYKEVMVAPGVFHSHVNCALRQQLSIVQRRNDVKVPVNIPMRFSYAGEKDVQVNVTGIIRNISAGGIFFTCQYSFLTGSIVEFDFSPRRDMAPLTLKAEILRMQDRDSLQADFLAEAGEVDLKGYGCRFIDISPHAEAQIRNFVFREDLIRRKKVFPVR